MSVSCVLFRFISSSRCNGAVVRLMCHNLNLFANVRCISALAILKSLKPLGINKEDLYKHPKLFYISKKDLEEKTKYLSKKVKDNEDVLCLLQLPMKDIIKYFEIRENKQKVADLSKILKCPNYEACQLFIKYGFLLRSKMSTIDEKVSIMAEGGVSYEDMKNDLWILTYTKEHIRSRMDVVKKLNIEPIRPWMLRCKEQILHRATFNKEENIQAMAPHDSTEEFICHRLGLSSSEYAIFVSKYPQVAKVQVSKLKELIDFLLYEGFTTALISQTPRILCHSVHTIKERLILLRELQYKPTTLSVLCRNKVNFENFIAKLKKENWTEPR